MTITLGPKLEAALNDLARKQGLSPDALAVKVLSQHLLDIPGAIEPNDDWERRLLGFAIPCGVSLSNEDLDREKMYDR